MLTLQGEAPYRVLGFGSLTPGPPPARTHVGVVDIAVHANYTEAASSLLTELIARAVEKDVITLKAYVLSTDEAKVEWFAASGFDREAVLTGDVIIDGSEEDILILRRSL